MEPKTILLSGMIVIAMVYLASWYTTVNRQRASGADTTPLGPEPRTLGISFIANFFDTLGIGYYAPCLIMISLLGMNPTAAFPIMMGACAFLMPVGSLQFIRKQSYDLRAAIGLMIGGPLAVVIAAFIVKSLPLDYVRWGVVVVVIYTAVGMLRTAAAERAIKSA